MKRSRLSRNVNSRKRTRLKKPEFYEKDTLSEREVLLLKRRMSHGKVDVHKVLEKMPTGGWKLTPQQSEKGFNWLLKQWKTPTGAERKNNPFGQREEHVLEKFDEFRLIDFMDTATYSATQMGIHFYIPVYEIKARDGTYFQYYVDYKGIHITG